MTQDKVDLLLSSNPDLEKRVLHIPADSPISVAALIKAKEEGAKVIVEKNGSVQVTVPDIKKA